MVATVPTLGPVVAGETERPVLAELRSLLDAEQGDLHLIDDRGVPVEIPETVERLLRQMVQALADDRPVAVVALQRELTVWAAANLLNVRVPYMVRLLDEGTVPSTGSGARRRVPFDDLMAYKARRDDERREALDEMTRISQEMGLYDLDFAGQLEWRDEDGDTTDR